MQRKFPFKSSYLLALALLVAHMMTIIAIHALSLSGWVEVAVTVLLLTNFIYLVTRYVLLRSIMSCVSLRLDGEFVELEFYGGAVKSARLGSGSLVMPGLAVLQLKFESSWMSYWLPIFSDTLDAESFRQLCVQLKWG